MTSVAHFKTYTQMCCWCCGVVKCRSICARSVNIWKIDAIERKMSASWMLHVVKSQKFAGMFKCSSKQSDDIMYRWLIWRRSSGGNNFSSLP